MISKICLNALAILMLALTGVPSAKAQNLSQSPPFCDSTARASYEAADTRGEVETWDGVPVIEKGKSYAPQNVLCWAFLPEDVGERLDGKNFYIGTTQGLPDIKTSYPVAAQINVAASVFGKKQSGWMMAQDVIVLLERHEEVFGNKGVLGGQEESEGYEAVAHPFTVGAATQPFQNPFTYPPSAGAIEAAANFAQRNSDDNNFGPPPAWLILIGVAAVIAASYGIRRASEPSTKGLRKFTEAEAEKNFPGYIVNLMEFEWGHDGAIRINSDGTRVNLSKWHFNEHSGEWSYIKKRIGGRVITRPGETYSTRWRIYYQVGDFYLDETTRPLANIGFMVLIGATVSLFTYAITSDDEPIVRAVIEPIAAIVFCPMCIFAGIAPAALTKAIQIGPEPLKRKVEDFGPHAATTAKSHPAQDDLTYKPAGT